AEHVALRVAPETANGEDAVECALHVAARVRMRERGEEQAREQREWSHGHPPVRQGHQYSCFRLNAGAVAWPDPADCRPGFGRVLRQRYVLLERLGASDRWGRYF